MENWVTIKNLKKRNSDLGSRSIAKILGISRNTVRNALLRASPPKYTREERTNPDLEPFLEYIFEGVVAKKLRGSRILKEIRSKGYKGSQSAFYRHLSKIELPVKRTYQPYETGPGEQAQFDWSPYTILIAGESTKVFVFSYILGFSRYRVYDASLSDNQGSVFEALENGLHQTGGVTERVQVDNSRCFIDTCSNNNLKWNERYLAFCGHYGFKPSRSLPYHPWSKGKVENTFDYLEDHFIKGNTFESFNDFLKKLKTFESEVNERIHQTTRKTPNDLFEAEKDALVSLPDSRYVNTREENRKVTADCLLSFDGNRYSAPWPFACKEVWLRVSRGCFLNVYYSRNVLIAIHQIPNTKGNIVIDPTHYKAHRIEPGSWQRLSETFLRQFPDHQWFLDKLKAQKRINPAYHLTRILDLTRFYQPADLANSFLACQQYDVYTSVFVKGFLENHCRIIVEPTQLSYAIRVCYSSSSIKSTLHEYKREALL